MLARQARREVAGMSRRIVLPAGVLLWLGFWFWAFSFGYSDSFFDYDLCSRLSVFVAALFGAVVVPVSGYLAWRRHPSLPGALGAHAVGLVLAVGPIVLAPYALSRLSGSCRLEGDDAMGAGFDLLILLGIGATSLVVLLVAAAIRGLARSRRERGRAP